MIPFILKSTICLGVFYLSYVILLGRLKAFHFNRYFLLFSLFASLTAPLLRISIDVHDANPSIVGTPIVKTVASVNNMAQSSLSATPARGVSVQSHFPETYDIITAVYFAGVLILLLRFAKNLVNLIYKSGRGRKVKYGQTQITLLDGTFIPYSFFGSVFISLKDYEEGLADHSLINHELAHKEQLHSLDILIIELVKVFYWFNPLVYLFGRAIKLNHEYLADESAVSSEASIADYSKKLLEISHNGRIHLASGLNYSQIKKRITMLFDQNERKHFAFRLTVLSLTTVLLFISTAFVPNDNSTAIKTPDPINTFTGTYSGYRINDSTYYAYGSYYITSKSGDTKITAHRLKVSIETSDYKNYFENDFLSGRVFKEGVEVYTNELFLDKIITYRADNVTFSKDSLTIVLKGRAEIKGEDVKVESDLITLHLTRWKRML